VKFEFSVFEGKILTKQIIFNVVQYAQVQNTMVVIQEMRPSAAYHMLYFLVLFTF